MIFDLHKFSSHGVILKAICFTEWFPSPANIYCAPLWTVLKGLRCYAILLSLCSFFYNFLLLSVAIAVKSSLCWHSFPVSILLFVELASRQNVSSREKNVHSRYNYLAFLWQKRKMTNRKFAIYGIIKGKLFQSPKGRLVSLARERFSLVYFL